MSDTASKYKTFKERCTDNPEFKKKHLEYIKSYILCPVCDKQIQRCAYARHKKSSKHISILEEKKTLKEDIDKTINDEINILREKIEELIKNKNK